MKPASRRPALIVFLLIAVAIIVGIVYIRSAHTKAAADGSDGGGASSSGSADSGDSSASGGDTSGADGSAASGGGGTGGSSGGHHHKHHKGGGGGAGGSGGADSSGGTDSPAGPGVAPVQVATVQTGNLTSSVQVTGNIEALQDEQVSAKATARVTYVVGLEGTLVHAGQVVVQQDATDLEATVRQDQDQTVKDRAAIDQANDNYQIQQIQARQNVLNAQAAVNAARQSYIKYKQGSRPQDILQAEAQTIQAQTNANNAKVTMGRDQILYSEGAIAKSQLDNDTSTYQQDQALYQKAVAYESEEKEGYQIEDVRSQLELVREAEANLKNQVAAQKNIEVQLGNVESAKAQLQSDLEKMKYDQQQVDYASIRSPMDGIIAARETLPGELATTGTNVMRIVNIDRLYFEPTISETDFSSSHVGDPVQVKVDALPGRTFAGRVAALFPAADPTTRVFSVRVVVDNPQHLMRPGMFARGSLVTQVAHQVAVIPTSALVSAEAQQGFEANTSSNAPIQPGIQMPQQEVVIARSDNTAEVRPVTIGIVNMDSAEVTSGVQPGDRIVVVGQQGLKTGDKLSIVSTPSATPSSPQVAEHE